MDRMSEREGPGRTQAWTAPSAGCRIVRAPSAARAQDCLSRLASGVVLAACTTPNGPVGVLVNSLTSLSAQPPRVLFCVGKVEPAHPALLEAEAIGLSVLAGDQQAEADRFAGPDASPGRFGRGWTLSPNAPPRLADALASVEGWVRSRIDAGSHTVFVLDVTAAATRPGTPLIYFARSYLSAAQADEAAALA